MNLQEIVQQYRGTTLPKLIEKQIKSLNLDTLLKAIQKHLPPFSKRLSQTSRCLYTCVR